MPRKSAAAAPSAPRASASGSRANKPRRAAPSEHSDDGEDALDLDLDADMDVGDADEPEGADKEDEQLLVMLRELRSTLPPRAAITTH
ncbi:hypothetical protein FA95DRAFT_1560396 [Auriscalpium vulgare]|uniref:Uncharacterized protein n=1 Tax=Auriscalpium vulgare TaxID=40419 RepID=A0ACB8RPP0_9AGAM|nr:hypothetical protein FA95DRAFT_1560396 [Auriscalpium vulgare]